MEIKSVHCRAGSWLLGLPGWVGMGGWSGRAGDEHVVRERMAQSDLRRTSRWLRGVPVQVLSPHRGTCPVSHWPASGGDSEACSLCPHNPRALGLWLEEHRRRTGPPCSPPPPPEAQKPGRGRAIRKPLPTRAPFPSWNPRLP